MSREKPEEVGYCRPPSATRWKKGQSGNPRGARSGKRKRALSQIAEDITSRTLMHQGRALTYLDIILIQIFNKASRGNKRARRLLERILEYRSATPRIFLTTPEIEKYRKEHAVEEYNKFMQEMEAEEGPGLPTNKSLQEQMDDYCRMIQMPLDEDDE